MPKFRVTSPDGVSWEVNAPEGSTQQDAIAYVQKQFAGTAIGKNKAAQDVGEAVGGSAAKVPLIAAGRQADKLIEGVKQLGTGINVAGRELLGMDSGDQLRKMAAQDQMQTGNDQAYKPLQEQHPYLTGAAESAFLLGVPGGQLTTAARVGVPAAVAGANALMSYGSPEERLRRGVTDASIATVGGVVGEGVRKIIAPAKSSLTAAKQTALKDAAEKIGYTPRASDLTGNETLRRLEDAVARQPGGAGPMREFAQKNVVAVNRTAGRAIGEEPVEQITSDVFGAASDRIGGNYDKLRAKAKMPANGDVFDAVTRSETMLSRGDSTGPKKEAFDMLQRLKEQLYQTKEFDGATYQSWTSDLGAKARELGKTNRTAAAALREVEKAMDKVAQGADAPAWKLNDQQNAAMEMLMKPGVVNTATGDVSSLKLAGNMERQFGKNLKTGKVSGPLVDITNFARALPPMAEGSQTAGREAFGGLPGWMMAAPNYAAAKALTSGLGRDYLSKGLLGNAALSQGAGGILGRSALPLSIAEIEALLLGYQ